MLSGCASSVMTLPTENQRIDPIGLYVCSSTQGLDDKDLVHREFVINTASATLFAAMEWKHKAHIVKRKNTP